MKRIAVGKRDNVKEIRADGKEAFYIGRWEKGRGGQGGDVGKVVRRRVSGGGIRAEIRSCRCLS